jgi:hypothetical protein
MGVSRWPGQSAARSLLLFQTGRLLGYAALGAIAAVSMNALGWLDSITETSFSDTAAVASGATRHFVKQSCPTPRYCRDSIGFGYLS